MDVQGKTVRGILKNDPDYAQIQTELPKSAKFDELNVLETFHPVGKDYGHMIIDEPKTPFVFENDLPRDLDTTELINKLRLAAQSETPSFGIEDDSDDSSLDEDYPESVDEKVRRMEFERRRKLHYKEFLSVPLARRLIEEEFGDYETTEETVPDETEHSCIPEQCPTYDLSIEEHYEANPKSTSTIISYLGSVEHVPQPELEPGFDPDHHCYKKLMAEMLAPVPAPANKEHSDENYEEHSQKKSSMQGEN